MSVNLFKSIMLKSLLAALKETMEQAGSLENSYIVGGTVRDIILKREIKDVDIAIKGNPVLLAKNFASIIRGTLIPLHDEFPTVRVVKKEWIFDFAALRGDSIESDLLSRDFTINAMAIPISGTFEDILDVTDGRKDLLKGVVRMVSRDNLVADPLRMLRAYRFAAQLGFDIDAGTASAVSSLKGLISNSAAERIWSELKAIFSAKNSSVSVRQMVESGLLLQLIPEISSPGLSVPGDNPDKAAFGHALAVYEDAGNIIDRVNGHLPFPERFKQYLHSEATTKGLLKLAILLGEAGAAGTNAVGTVESICQRFKASLKETAYLVKVLVNRPRTALLHEYTASKRAMVELLNAVGDELYAHLIIGMAWERTKKSIHTVNQTNSVHTVNQVNYVQPAYPSGTASQEIHTSPESQACPANINRYLNDAESLIIFYTCEYLPRANQPRFITGKDLIEIFGLKPSPYFKKIIDEITDGTLEGAINTREQAIEEVRLLLSEWPQARE
ncbi:MAG: CCA tRNA nucleotidyltransferase [Nitrospirae bacterium]|nr:CCA tRNA nucleotidyltransferase [Nitrospirota bacterium]